MRKIAIDLNAINNAVANGGTGTKKSGDTLGKDEFLKLMIAQMQNQDPLEPQSDAEFIAQLAQFTSLEQMQNMNSTMQLNSAIGLIGSSVEWADKNGNLNIGVVTSARMYNGTAQVMIGDTAVDLDKVKTVTNDGTPVYAAISFIGSQINWLDAEGKTQTGIVESIKVVNNYPLLVVGKSLVDVNSVISVKSPEELAEEVSEETSAARKMIGSHITWKDDKGNEYTGFVSAVQAFDGKPYLVIANKDASYTYVSPSSVTSSTPVEETAKEALKLIGTEVTWTYTDGGGVLQTQTGHVNSMKYIDNVPYLVVGKDTLVSLDQLVKA